MWLALEFIFRIPIRGKKGRRERRTRLIMKPCRLRPLQIFHSPLPPGGWRGKKWIPGDLRATKASQEGPFPEEQCVTRGGRACVMRSGEGHASPISSNHGCWDRFWGVCWCLEALREVWECLECVLKKIRAGVEFCAGEIGLLGQVCWWNGDSLRSSYFRWINYYFWVGIVESEVKFISGNNNGDKIWSVPKKVSIYQNILYLILWKKIINF